MSLGKISRNASLWAGIGGLGGLLLSGPVGLVAGGIVGGSAGVVWTQLASTTQMPKIPNLHVDRRETWHCQEADGEMVARPHTSMELLSSIAIQDLADLKALLYQNDMGQSTRQLLSDLETLNTCLHQFESDLSHADRTRICQDAVSLWGNRIAILLAPMADQNDEIRLLRNELRTTMDQIQKAA